MSDVRAMLQPLIQQARDEGKWLWTSYQDIWFSPDDLDAENANGKFLWGPVNWKLRDPRERLAEAAKRLASAQSEVDLIKSKL